MDKNVEFMFTMIDEEQQNLRELDVAFNEEIEHGRNIVEDMYRDTENEKALQKAMEKYQMVLSEKIRKQEVLNKIGKSIKDLLDSATQIYNDDADLEYDDDGYDVYGYNKEGYDRDGYDRDGYDEDGYDENGYDDNGYDANGYDEEGYDAEGYDVNGYNEDGYDEFGYDSEGYDEEGYNEKGYDEFGNTRESENE